MMLICRGLELESKVWNWNQRSGTRIRGLELESEVWNFRESGSERERRSANGIIVNIKDFIGFFSAQMIGKNPGLAHFAHHHEMIVLKLGSQHATGIGIAVLEYRGSVHLHHCTTDSRNERTVYWRYYQIVLAIRGTRVSIIKGMDHGHCNGVTAEMSWIHTSASLISSLSSMLSTVRQPWLIKA